MSQSLPACPLPFLFPPLTGVNQLSMLETEIAVGPPARLSERERELARAICKGLMERAMTRAVSAPPRASRIHD